MDLDKLRDERPASLSGAYLLQALESLHAAGDPDALYGPTRLDEDVAEGRSFFIVQARQNRVQSCWTAVIFAALAAEAYVNEFLASKLDAKKDRDGLDRLSTVDKYVLGTRVAYPEETLFRRDDEVIPTLAELFGLRNKLVHPKPGFAPSKLLAPPGEFEGLVEPPKVAHYIVMVAGAAVLLMRRAYPDRPLDVPADMIWFGRTVILEYGKRATKLPALGAASPAPLFKQAVDRLRKNAAERRTSAGPKGASEEQN